MACPPRNLVPEIIEMLEVRRGQFHPHIDLSGLRVMGGPRGDEPFHRSRLPLFLRVLEWIPAQRFSVLFSHV